MEDLGGLGEASHTRKAGNRDGWRERERRKCGEKGGGQREMFHHGAEKDFSYLSGNHDLRYYYCICSRKPRLICPVHHKTMIQHLYSSGSSVEKGFLGRDSFDFGKFWSEGHFPYWTLSCVFDWSWRISRRSHGKGTQNCAIFPIKAMSLSVKFVSCIIWLTKFKSATVKGWIVHKAKFAMSLQKMVWGRDSISEAIWFLPTFSLQLAASQNRTWTLPDKSCHTAEN